ncbi:DNA polymerase IV [Rubripirellula lacrimiformis]|uniref:DNA polymerase IV n=2 Tax=Rubripirellula lacrimiformis TaxID=1930273 RepID=A0A517NGW2_9BACT|nr:DNA polymerase IV [Rubripirellula lacrimiformis]
MSIAQAREMCLAASIPGLLIEKHDALLDRQSLDQVVWWMQQKISPLVAIESLDIHPWAGHPRHQCESLWCEIDGAAHLFGGESGLLVAVTDLLESLGLAGRLAIADSFGAAWAVAHTRIAKSHAAADRCFIVPPGTNRQAIEPLPVDSLRIAPETVHTLARLGIERVGQLLRLPRSGLAPRLGIHLVRRIEHALGEVAEPVKAFHAEVCHSETLSLEYPTTDLPILVDRVERLIQMVRAGLATCQRGALRMTCRLDLSVHPPRTIDIGLFAPSADAKHLSGLLIHRLEQIRLRGTVDRITVSVPLTGPLRTVQTSLFDSSSDDSLQSLSGSSISRLVDSLSGRLGRNAVVEVKLSNDPLPENSCFVVPLAGNQIAGNEVAGKQFSGRPGSRSQRSYDQKLRSRVARRNRLNPPDSGASISAATSGSLSQNPKWAPSPADAMRRPVALLSRPVPLTIAFDKDGFFADTQRPSLPNGLRVAGVTHKVIRSWGPERIETGWWKGPSIRRDYYRVETDRGQWWWIFRDSISPVSAERSLPRYRWMLHGHFA